MNALTFTFAITSWKTSQGLFISSHYPLSSKLASSSWGKSPPQQELSMQLTDNSWLSKNLYTIGKGRVCLCIINLWCVLCLWAATWPQQIELKPGKWAKERGGEICFSSGDKSEQKWSFHFVVKADSAVVLGWMHAVHLFYNVIAFSFLVFYTSALQRTLCSLCALHYFICYLPSVPLSNYVWSVLLTFFYCTFKLQSAEMTELCVFCAVTNTLMENQYLYSWLDLWRRPISSHFF